MVDVTTVSRDEFEAIVNLWEASVRATHDFLPEEDIAFFRPLILNQYLDAVELRCARDRDSIHGFVGVADGQVEMLFIAPNHFGEGTGTLLLAYAVNELGARTVDVNEQNPRAVGFYERFGFRVVGRSPVDGLGKPYPILHMELGSSGKARP